MNEIHTTIDEFNYNSAGVCINPEIFIDYNDNQITYEGRVAKCIKGWNFGYSLSHKKGSMRGGGCGVWLNPKGILYETKLEAQKACIDFLIKNVTPIKGLQKLKDWLPQIEIPFNTNSIAKNNYSGHGKKKEFKNYIGSKAAHGLLQFIINNIPLHDDYYELFAGSAAVFFNKRPANNHLIMEKDYNQYMALYKKMTTGPHPVKDCAIKYLKIRLQAKKLNEDRGFTRNDFIYLDPPYPMAARNNGKAYYNHEMTDDDHVQLLSTIVDLDANIMISTRQNDLYNKHLKSWNKKEFLVASRTGAVNEIIYMNYDITKLPLHQYDFVGDGCTDRQRVKRKVSRFADKLDSLEPKERDLFIQTVITKYPTEVKRFLTIHK